MGRTDADLIEASRRGDAAAFGEIIERYQALVCAVAFSAVRDRTASEDIAQDTFVLAWQKLGSLRDAERLPGWLCGIARNVARSHRRRVQRETSADVEIATDGTPFDAISAREAEAALVSALERVPHTYREPLVMVYYEQQSVKDVARALGTSDDAIHQRLSRGRQFLADDVERVLAEPRSRPRRELRAAVLAILAGGATAAIPSHVEAAPRSKGWTMLKIAALVTAAAVATTTVVVKARLSSSSHDDAPAASTTPAAPGAAPTTLARLAPAHASPPLVHVGTTVPPPALPAPAATSDDVSCTTVARHLAEMGLELVELPKDPGVHDLALDVAAKAIEGHCSTDGWSKDYMTCVLGAPDVFSAHLDCAAYKPQAQLPPQLAAQAAAIMGARIAVQPTTDTSCAGVGKHIADLANLDISKLDFIPAKRRADISKRLASVRATMAAKAQASCEDTEWPAERRQCIAAATSPETAHACM